MNQTCGSVWTNSREEFVLYTPDFKVEYLDGKVEYHEVYAILTVSQKLSWTAWGFIIQT